LGIIVLSFRVNENPSESGGSFDASGAFHGGGGYSDEEEVSIYFSYVKTSA
jgi:hypothetical protein